MSGQKMIDAAREALETTAVAKALIDADPSMSGYHATHIKAKWAAAQAAIAALDAVRAT